MYIFYSDTCVERSACQARCFICLRRTQHDNKPRVTLSPFDLAQGGLCEGSRAPAGDGWSGSGMYKGTIIIPSSFFLLADDSSQYIKRDASSFRSGTQHDSKPRVTLSPFDLAQGGLCEGSSAPAGGNVPSWTRQMPTHSP